MIKITNEFALGFIMGVLGILLIISIAGLVTCELMGGVCEATVLVKSMVFIAGIAGGIAGGYIASRRGE